MLLWSNHDPFKKGNETGYKKTRKAYKNHRQNNRCLIKKEITIEIPDRKVDHQYRCKKIQRRNNFHNPNLLKIERLQTYLTPSALIRLSWIVKIITKRRSPSNKSFKYLLPSLQYKCIFIPNDFHFF